MLNYCLVGGGSKGPMLKEALEYVDDPRALLITEACSTPKSYDKKVPKLLDFFAELGVPAEVASEGNIPASAQEYGEKFGRNNVIYTIGGNTPKLIERLSLWGMVGHIKSAAAAGKLLAGTSAGALMPFAYGQTDPTATTAEQLDNYQLVPLLGMLKTTGIVHANSIRPGFSTSRLDQLTSEQLRLTGHAIAIDENAALMRNPDTGIGLGLSTQEAYVHIVRLAANGQQMITSYQDSAEFAEAAQDILAA